MGALVRRPTVRPMAIRVTMAGEVGIDVDGVAVDISALGRLGRLFMAYLVCERHRPVPRDELAEVLWGEDALPRSWEQMLRGNASRLRMVLASVGPDPSATVVSAFGAYQVRLPADVLVDVEEAACAVDEAVTALQAGDAEEAYDAAAGAETVAARGFLPGWSGLWVERRQAELRELRLRALELLGRAACARSLWGEAIVAAEGAVGIEPFRESGYQILIAAHRGAGNLGEAFRVYERCRRILTEELGVGPSPATEGAYLSMLGDEPTPPAVEDLHVPLQVALSPSRTGFLVGRREESDRLQAALGRATTDGRQAVLVSGEPGIGKTALVAEFARAAYGQGGTVLYGRCDEDLAIAYQPFAEALGHYVANCPLTELAAHLAAHDTELSRITPEMMRRMPDARPPLVTGSEGDRYRLFEAVADLLGRASTHGLVVLALDDLQWAAPPTLSLLRQVLRAATPSLVVIGTYRHTEIGPEHPLSTTLADLRREAGVERILLEGLDANGVAAFLEHSEGHSLDAAGQALARALHDRTGGNPFFVGEFLRHLAETGSVLGKEGAWSYYDDAGSRGLPEGVHDVLTRRLGRLSAQANTVLSLASVVGLDFELQLLDRAHAPGVTETTLDALDDAVAARVVTELGAGRYQFAHALVREVVYSSLTATRRARLHHRIADALASLPGDTAPRIPSLAHHFAEAASDGAATEAGDYALAAARQAFEASAWEDALSYVARGLVALSSTAPAHIERRFDLLLLDFEMQAILVQVQSATNAIFDAAEAALLLGSPTRVARAVSVGLLWTGGGDRRVIALAEQTLAQLGDSEPALRARLLAGLASTVEYRQAGTAEPGTARALALARETGDGDALHAALLARGSVLSDLPDARATLEVEEELLAKGWPSGPVAGPRWMHSLGRGRARARLVLGDRSGFESDIEAIRRWFGQLRASGLGAQLAFWDMARALLDGRFDEVEGFASAALELAPQHPDAWAIGLSKLALERGRPDAFMDEAKRVLAVTPNNHLLASMVALMHLEIDEADIAVGIVDDLSVEHFQRVTPWLKLTTLLYVSEIVTAVGDNRRGAELYRMLLPYAGLAAFSGIGAHCPGAVDRYLGRIAATLGREDEAEAHFRAALQIESQLRAPPALARSSYDYGRMLIQRGRPSDLARGRMLLESTVRTATQSGMTRLAAQASALV